MMIMIILNVILSNKIKWIIITVGRRLLWPNFDQIYRSVNNTSH